MGLRHGCSSDSALSNGTEEKLNGGSEGRRKRKGKDSYTSRSGMQKWVVVVGLVPVMLSFAGFNVSSPTVPFC